VAIPFFTFSITFVSLLIYPQNHIVQSHTHIFLNQIFYPIFFQNIVSNPKNSFYSHKEDYDLFEIASFNSDTGVIQITEILDITFTG
jgi:hypothetical protein